MKQKITSLVIAFTFFHSQLLYALPVKNNATNGVKFNQNQNTLNITAPDRSVINYDSFDIAVAERVNFIQPSASAGVLNRVLSGGASSINGALAANGNVLLINPSGVMFGGGAKVNANSFIASTKDVSDSNFAAGLLKFEGSTNGKIVNSGLIEATKNVGLIAANIENKGTLKAGKNVGLIAGNKGSISVDFEGDGLVNFAADSSKIGSGSISNSGTIKAGQVLLTANDVNNVLKNVINNTGTIEATKAVAGENGSIMLVSDASVKNTGNLKAPEGEIVLKTGGDLNSEGTISAVDGEVDIEATGDVTSSGTLEAGKLTEKGATFGISGTFAVDESSLKNDDDAIEFTGDTTLTGNISDVDNIIVGGGVTLTLAADVTLTAGADTSANTNVNDSSNMISSSGGDFIWMADDSVIDGAGYNLTFDTKGTNSWLNEITGVNDLTFINGNADKVSDTVTYELKKDVSVTGTFTIGEGASLYLYPLDATNAPVSDIKLTADRFEAGGSGTNAGSIRLHSGKNLTLDATSTTENSNVNFLCNSITVPQSPDAYPYLEDIAYGFIGSTGSLTFLGDNATAFNIGISGTNYDHNIIRVRGLDIGDDTGRVANVSIDAPVDYLASEYLGSEDFNIHNASSLMLHNDTLLGFKNLVMDADATIDAGSHEIRLLSDSSEEKSVVGHLQNVTDLEFIRDGDVNKEYDLLNNINITGEFAVGEGVSLFLNPLDTTDITLAASNFATGGTGETAGSIQLNDKTLTLDATSESLDSYVNFYVNDQLNNMVYSENFLTFFGHEDTKFVVGVANNDTATDNKLIVKGINLGNISDRLANVEIQDSISELSASAGNGAYITINQRWQTDRMGSNLILNGDMMISGEGVRMSNNTSIDANGNNVDFFFAGTTPYAQFAHLNNFNDLSLYSAEVEYAERYYLTKNLDISGVLSIGEFVELNTSPKNAEGGDVNDILIKASSFAAGGVGKMAGSIDLGKDVTLQATSETVDSYVNFSVNDQENDTVYAAKSLTFLGHEDTKFVVGVANNDTADGNKLMVNGVTLGDDVDNTANVELQSSISEISAAGSTGGNFTMNNNSGLTVNTDTAVVGKTIQMAEGASVEGNSNNVMFYATEEGGTSTIANLNGVKDASFFGNTLGAGLNYDLTKDVDISGTLSIADNARLRLTPLSAGAEASAISVKAGNFYADGTTETAGSFVLNGKSLTLESTSTTLDSFINFYVNDQANNVVYNPNSLTFLSDAATNIVLGVSNYDSETGNKIMAKGITLGNAEGKSANVILSSAISELSATADTGDDLTLKNASKLTLNTDTALVGRMIDMDSASSVNAQGNDISIYTTHHQGLSSLGFLESVNNLSFNTSGSYDLNQDLNLTGVLALAQNANLNIYCSAITASSFDFAGSGLTAGTINLKNSDLTLEATSAIDDSFINFFINSNMNTAYSGGALTFLGNENTKFVVDVGNNPNATGNVIKTRGITFGNGSDKVANVEFADSISEISADASLGGAFTIRDGSKLVLSTDTTFVGKGIDMAEGATVDAGGNNLVFYAVDLYSRLGSLLNVNNLTLVDGIIDGAKAQFELLVDTLTASNITLMDEIKIRATKALTTITADNFTMGSFTELNAWQDTSLPEIDTNGDIVLNTTNSAALDFVACVENFTVDSAGTLSMNYAAANGNINLTAGTSANLGGIQYVNTLALNGNGATYALNDSISLDGSFSVGEGVVLNIENDLTLAADYFAFYSDVVGLEASIALNQNYKDLTLQANSATTDSNVNFYVSDQGANTAYSTGSLTFLGNENTKFVVDVANNDSVTDNKIMTKGLSLGNDEGKTANVELVSSISELSATADYGSKFSMYNSSALTLNRDTVVVGETIQMLGDSKIDAQGSSLVFYVTSTNPSHINELDSVYNLSYYSAESYTPSYYYMQPNMDIIGTLNVGSGTALAFDGTQLNAHLKAANFNFSGVGSDAGSLTIGNKALVIEATSADLDSDVNFTVTDKLSDTAYNSGSVQFIGHQDTKFNVGVSDNDVATGNKIMLSGITLGDNVDKTAHVVLKDSVSEISAAGSSGGNFQMYNASKLTLADDLSVVGKRILMDELSSIDAADTQLTFYVTHAGGTSSITNLDNLYNVSFNGVGATYNLQNALTGVNNFSLGYNMDMSLGSGITDLTVDNLLYLGDYSKVTLSDTPLAITANAVIFGNDSEIDANNNDLTIESSYSAYLRKFSNLNDLNLNNGNIDGTEIQYDLTEDTLIATDITIGDNVNVRGIQETTTITANNFTMGTNTQLNAWQDVSVPGIDSHGSFVLDVAAFATLDEIVCVEDLTLKGGGDFTLKDHITALNADGDLTVGSAGDKTEVLIHNDVSINANSINFDNSSIINSRGTGYSLTFNAQADSSLSYMGGFADLTINNANFTLNKAFALSGNMYVNNAVLLLDSSSTQLVADSFNFNNSSIDAQNNDLALCAERSSVLGGFSNLKDLILRDVHVDGVQVQYDLTASDLTASNLTLGGDVKIRGTQATTTITADNLDMQGNTQLNAWADTSIDGVDAHGNIVLDISTEATLDEIVCVEDLTLKGGGRFFLKDNLTQLNADGDLTIGVGASDGTNLTLGNDVSIAANSINMGSLASITGEGFDLTLFPAAGSILSGGFNGVNDLTLYNSSYTVNDDIVIDGDFRAVNGITLLLNDTGFDLAANSFDLADAIIDGNGYDLAFHAHNDSILGNMSNIGTLEIDKIDAQDTPTYTQVGDVSVQNFVLSQGVTYIADTTNAFSATQDFQKADGSTFKRFAGGDGLSEATAYQVADVYGWVNSVDGALGEYFSLANDIDFSVSSPWVNALAPKTFDFTMLDGQGYTISNFTIGAGVLYSGSALLDLPYDQEGITVKNLNIRNADVEGYTGVGALLTGLTYNSMIDNCNVYDSNIRGENSVGGLVGSIWTNSTVQNSSVIDSEVTNIILDPENTYYRAIGGLAGQVWSGGLVTDSFVQNTDVYGLNSVGGFIGEGSGSTSHLQAGDYTEIEGCYVDGGIVFGRLLYPTGYAYGNSIGGFIGSFSGSLSDTAQIINCSSSATEFGASSVGGFVGNLRENTVISNSSATGNVWLRTNTIFQKFSFGGFAGSMNGADVYNSSATGNVNYLWWGGGTADTGMYSGGFVGSVANSNIYDSYASGNVKGELSTGGFAGSVNMGVNIERCSSSGDVIGANKVGGFAGSVYNVSISDSTVYGLDYFSGTENVAGFVGYETIEDAGTYSNCKWDSSDLGLSINQDTSLGDVEGIIDLAAV